MRSCCSQPGYTTLPLRRGTAPAGKSNPIRGESITGIPVLQGTGWALSSRATCFGFQRAESSAPRGGSRVLLEGKEKAKSEE